MWPHGLFLASYATLPLLLPLSSLRQVVATESVAQPPGCVPWFMPPAPPLHATDLNGIALPDVCLDSDGPHHVFIIGDWGGISKGGNPPYPADHRSQMFPGSQRDWVEGVDDSAQLRVARQMKIRANSSTLDYVLNVGDSFYWGGIKARCGTPPFDHLDTGQWGPIFEEVYDGPELAGKPWLGVLGNHDYGGYSYTSAWDQLIGYTWGGPESSGRWVMPALYWRVKVQYSDFTVDYYFVDSNVFSTNDPHEDLEHNVCGLTHNEEQDSCGPQGPQSVWDCVSWFHRLWEEEMLWLESNLRTSDATWQIVVTHIPPGLGKHDWRRLSHRYGIDLIITGHMHLQVVYGPDAEDNVMKPTATVISGGGGGITSEPKPSKDGHDDAYGFVDMTLGREEILLEAISHGGQIRSTTSVRPRLPVEPVDT